MIGAARIERQWTPWRAHGIAAINRPRKQKNGIEKIIGIPYMAGMANKSRAALRALKECIFMLRQILGNRHQQKGLDHFNKAH
jgi:hypothetical protein